MGPLGLITLNALVAADSVPDYRGEVKVLLINLSNEPFVIKHGERIAQMVIARFQLNAPLTMKDWRPFSRVNNLTMREVSEYLVACRTMPAVDTIIAVWNYRMNRNLVTIFSLPSLSEHIT